MSGLTQPRLTPRIADTAKALIVIYLSITLAETLALLLAGMPLYDAVVHTFGTVATGGFSTKTASVGFYDSLAVEVIIGFFMVASGVSFSLYYLFYTRRRLNVFLDRELLAYLGIIAAASLFIWGILVLGGDYGSSWGTALRDSAFTVSSVITTTGYITVDFDQWDSAAEVILILLMFVGGCAGSTAGGIKVIRILIIFRTILQDVFRMIHPRAVTPLQIGGRVVPETVRIAVLGLFASWIGVFGIATFIVALQQNLTPLSSATAVATTLNDVGPGLAQVGATESFEIVDPLGRFVLTACMLLGRLEIFTVLALLSPAFWKR
jgi:trk system potassium uptake protein